jgi:hypothetical protein
MSSSSPPAAPGPRKREAPLERHGGVGPGLGAAGVAQSMAREFAPQGIHVAHVVIDGQINTPRVRAMFPDREEHTMLSPEAIADTYWRLHVQHRTA